ncbi:DUF3105 domain-containing protein [Nocardioides sp. SYSU DS0663]|uniref:DUF3105 domain-containing protein n=1 Tax=Nocardioides sp. SYSU DS0663 TaxID=3416445 RepID=UPI003F4BE970
MAKKAKNDRQAVIDQIRKKQKSADKRRSSAIISVCVLVALLIVGAAAYKPIVDWWDLRKFNDIELASIGGPASVCQEITTEPATEGSGNHVDTGTQVDYEFAPPAFGPHWNELNVAPDPMERKFYSAGDRPELESLVHNSEHGYTILWYDETAAEDEQMMDTIRAIADKFKGTSNMRLKFKAVPWTSEDGEPFPDGQHIAYTHWSIGGADAADTTNQVGVWQYCSEPSGEALEDFMIEYPYMDSPEPNAM